MKETVGRKRQETQHFGARLVSSAPRILDRYVAREFLVSYIITLFVVLSLRIILDLFIGFDEFGESKEGQAAPNALVVLGNIVDYYGPKAFEYFRDFSGTIILLAAVFSLARLTRQDELTAVLASGVSLKRVVAPIVLLGFLLNLFMVFDQEFILPRLANLLVRRQDEMVQLRTLEVWLLNDKDSSLFSAKFDPENRTLTDVWVILRDNGRVTARITAPQAEWDEQNRRWNLADGLYFNLDTESKRTPGIELIKPCSYYPVKGPTNLTSEYLWLQRHANFKSLMSSRELTALTRREIKSADRAEAVSEKHFRFTDPIINMVMLLLGLPLIVSRERKSTKTAIFLVILGAGGCFVATFACKLLAGGALSPLLAAWMPIIVFMPLSVLALDAIKT